MRYAVEAASLGEKFWLPAPLCRLEDILPLEGYTKGKAWYAARVRAKGEARASLELSARGFETFLPVCRMQRRWSDRLKTLEIPIFPGYLFCRFQAGERIRVLEAPAVIDVVGCGGSPIPLDDAEIEAIQTMAASPVNVTPWPYLSSGQRVRIKRGPLAGLDGIVDKAEDGKARVVISVKLLQRAIAAEIERGWLTPIEMGGENAMRHFGPLSLSCERQYLGLN